MHPYIPHWESLTLEQQVAQLFVVRASGHLFDHEIEYPTWEVPNAVLHRWVHDLGVGGVILLGGSAAEVGLRTQQLQSWASIPLLLCADVEEGVGQRFTGATWFPPPMALNEVARHDRAQAIALAEAMGRCTAQEAIAIGLNWLLAPTVDVNNNPLNPVINIRAFGETPEVVSQLTQAFIKGAKSYPVLTAAKHFPGHGDTATDSHLDLPVLPHSRERLKEVEWVPFETAIAAGVDSMITAHLQLPALDETLPATLSPTILHETLRQQMGFNGLIVTDALIMGAIANRYGANEAPLLALEAGADILLMPSDPEGAIQTICHAVESGRVSVERIHDSLDRIWWAKKKLSPVLESCHSHAWEQVAPPPVQLEQIATDEAIATVNAILTGSTTVVHPALSRLMAGGDPGRNLIVFDSVLNTNFLGRQAPAVRLPTELGYQLQWVDSYAVPGSLEGDVRKPTLLQLFIRGNPFRSSASLIDSAKHWLTYLAETEQLQAVVIYGSPYVVPQIQPLLPPDVPYVFSYGQMPSAQAIALNALFTGTSTTTVSREFTT